MNGWKKIALRAAGFGAGFAVCAALIAGAAIWWTTRPPREKPWNSSALTAAYDGIGVEGETQNIEFFYNVTNNTDNDYHAVNDSEMHIGGILKDSKALSLEGANEDLLFIKYPIFIPARSTARFEVHTKFPYGPKEPSDDNSDARHDYRTKLSAFVSKDMGNLDGFVLMDDNQHYRINMPDGWTASGKEPLRIKSQQP